MSQGSTDMGLWGINSNECVKFNEMKKSLIMSKLWKYKMENVFVVP